MPRDTRPPTRVLATLPFSPAMLLGHGEVPLRSAYAVADPGGPSRERPKGPGVLYLTNHRLVFEAPVGRRGSGETDTQFEVSLHELRNVSIRRPRVGRPRLVLETHQGRPSFDVLDPDAWSVMIAQARRALPPPPGGSPSVHTIERHIIKVRCRYCGTLGDEQDGRCPSCGAPL
ncbi:MAG TPA: hypothetical protein VEE83_01330 [Thermoplasmata archaeon]|nr:hypothetical protein [Thermoplasmata archaeon]